MSVDYRRQSVRSAVGLLGGAAVVFLVGFLRVPPSLPLVAALAGVAVVLVGGSVLLEGRTLAGAWVVPTVAGAVIYVERGATPGDLRTVGGYLAAFAVLSAFLWPLWARSAELGESVGERLREK